MNWLNNIESAVIVCNGEFPKHEFPIAILQQAKTIICCDGAIDSLSKKNIKPTVIIGDLDSISNESRKKYSDLLILNTNQETNDLTKAVTWAISKNIKSVAIIGATGKREDHTLGNISLLQDYHKQISVRMYTDYGIFIPITKSTKFSSYKGQQVSIFALTPTVKIESKNLKFPLQNVLFNSWWKGTLNESLDKDFTLNFENGQIIVFQEY